MQVLIYILTDALITGVALFIVAQMTSVKIEFKEALICVSISALMIFIPVFGWIASIAVLFYLLQKFTQAPVFPDLTLLVVISKALSFGAKVAINSL